MKIYSILRCIGYDFAWVILVQIVSVLCHNTTATMAGSIVIMGALSLYSVRKNRYIIFSHGEKLQRQMPLSLLMGVGLAFFNAVSIVLYILGGNFESMLEMVSADHFLFLFLSSIAGAVAEELFFRGVLLNICRPCFSAGFAIGIPALIFAVFHLAPERMLHTLIGGLLFGAVYYYTENIFTSVVMHAVTNVVASVPVGYLFALIGTKTGYLPAALLLTLAGLVTILCASVVFYREFVRGVKEGGEESG